MEQGDFSDTYSGSMAGGHSKHGSMRAGGTLGQPDPVHYSQSQASHAAVMALQALQRENERLTLELDGHRLREKELLEKVEYLEEFWSCKLEQQLMLQASLEKEKMALRDQLQCQTEAWMKQNQALKGELDEARLALSKSQQKLAKESDRLAEQLKILSSELETCRDQKAADSVTHQRALAKLRSDHRKEVVELQECLMKLSREVDASKAAALASNKEKLEAISELKKKQEKKVAALSLENSELRTEVRRKEHERASEADDHRSKRKQDQEKLAEVKKKLEAERSAREQEREKMGSQIQKAEGLLANCENEMQRYSN